MKAREDDIVIFARTDAGNAVGGSWKEAARRVKALKEMGVDAVLPMTRTKENMERFRQEYPDNDIVMEGTAYFNGMHPDEMRRYGFQLISFPSGHHRGIGRQRHRYAQRYPQDRNRHLRSGQGQIGHGRRSKTP